MNLPALLIPLYLAPDGATVFKHTGTKPYTVRYEIKIYSDGPCDNKARILKADGVMFLVDASGTITAVPVDKTVRLEFHNWTALVEFANDVIDDGIFSDPDCVRAMREGSTTLHLADGPDVKLDPDGGA